MCQRGAGPCTGQTARPRHRQGGTLDPPRPVSGALQRALIQQRSVSLEKEASGSCLQGPCHDLSCKSPLPPAAGVPCPLMDREAKSCLAPDSVNTRHTGSESCASPVLRAHRGETLGPSRPARPALDPWAGFCTSSPASRAPSACLAPAACTARSQQSLMGAGLGRGRHGRVLGA